MSLNKEKNKREGYMLIPRQKLDLHQILGPLAVSKLQHLRFKKGDYLYKEGEKPRGIFYIETGMWALTRRNENGIESLLRIFTDHGLSGHRAFIADDCYQATAQALGPSNVIYLDRKISTQLISENTDFVFYMTTSLANDLKNAEERLAHMTGRSAHHRVIETLIYLKTLHPEFNWSRKEMAQFCGVKTETVSRDLSELEGEELIRRDKRTILISNEEKLVSYLYQKH